VSGGLPQRLRNLLQPDRDERSISLPHLRRLQFLLICKRC
jgi:hypothetical protein